MRRRWTEDKAFLMCGFTCFIAGLIMGTLFVGVMSGLSTPCKVYKEKLIKCEQKFEKKTTKKKKRRRK